MGSAEELRKQLDEVELAFEKASVEIKDRQASGQPVSEELFQRLYELDQQRKGLAARAEQ